MDALLRSHLDTRLQYAALPYRVTGGRLEVMLITSRGTHRWVVPKGWPIRGLKPHAAAAREAFEEAGLEGEVGRRALGAYRYDKRLKSGAAVPVQVEVFPFAVGHQRARWPERDQRVCRWMSPDEAAASVDEPGLAALIRTFGDILQASA